METSSLWSFLNLVTHALCVMVRNHPPIVWVVLYTVGVLEYPFDSGLRVNADAFELALRER